MIYLLVVTNLAALLWGASYVSKCNAQESTIRNLRARDINQRARLKELEGK